MGFFKKIKTKLEDTLDDLATIEHALILENPDKIILYQKVELEGDNVAYMCDEKLSPEVLELFNEVCSASSEARTGIARFIVESIKII